MAETGRLVAPAAPAFANPVTLVFVAALLLLRDVLPSSIVSGRAQVELIGDRPSYWHLVVTAEEIAIALATGGTAGHAVGILLGASPLLSRSFESFLYFLGTTPKI